jgi:dienelactone hydrolase
VRYTVLFILILNIVCSVSWAAKSKIRQVETPFAGSLLYTPNDGKSHPGVIMLHGSEGGSLPYAQLEAQYLAAHGYSVLVFCWYNCNRSPITSPMLPLENVELRKTIQAIEWLRKSSHANGKVALLGWSRGGEQALLLGSLAASSVELIAVHTPSDTVVAGFSWGAIDKRCWLCTSFDLACFNNTDDPSKWDWKNTRWNLVCGNPPQYPSTMNAWLLDGTPLKLDSVIEVEKFQKPIFISVGDKDELWDYKKSIRVSERLKKFNREVELYVFPNERHVFSPVGENRRHELLLKFLGRNLK